MKKRLFGSMIFLGLLGLSACENQQEISSNRVSETASIIKTSVSDRWYSQAQVEKGDALFQVNCASCHMADASGSSTWRKTDAQGNLPPPPLNGTAHAWHHPLSILRRTVRMGGVKFGGTMPSFSEQLNSEQIDNILAWVQSHWSEEIYRVWSKRDAQVSKPMQMMNKG